MKVTEIFVNHIFHATAPTTAPTPTTFGRSYFCYPNLLVLDLSLILRM